MFFDYLADHHPEVTRLEEIERTRHIEPYLAWARTRPWRGKNRERRTIGVVAFHQDVVDLRCFFEDIVGWAGRRRHRGGCCSTPTFHAPPTRCPER